MEKKDQGNQKNQKERPRISKRELEAMDPHSRELSDRYGVKPTHLKHPILILKTPQEWVDKHQDRKSPEGNKPDGD